jgi:hypothetical protein
MTADELAKLIPQEALDEISMRFDDDDEARLYLADALNAWPGMSQLDENDSATVRGVACLILPLKETPNAE